MALNLKTLGIRSLSAIVFVVLLIGSVLWNYWSFSIFFFAVSMLGLHEFYKISEKLGTAPYKGIGFFCGIFTYLFFLHELYFFVHKITLLLVPFIILAVALFSKRNNPIQNALFTFAGVLYSVLPFALLHGDMNFFDPDYYGKRQILGIIFLIWSNDTFAYLGGSLFGKHKMMERISPGKTWEGTIFGILVTIAVSFIIQKYWLDEDNSTTNKILWMVYGICVPILATIGDLIESMLKRQAGLKDSGNIMPGHGGILDRFDSLIFVSPFVYVINFYYSTFQELIEMYFSA